MAGSKLDLTRKHQGVFMKTQIFKSMAVALSLLCLVACGKKKDDGGSVTGGRGARAQVAGTSNLPTGQGGLAGQSGGYITGPNLDDAARKLVSVTITDPNSIGAIRQVTIQGQVYVDRQTGAVNPASSVIQVSVYDDKVNTIENGQTVGPIQVTLKQGTGSAVAYNANLTFSDSYGSIQISGKYDMNYFDGTVSFSNSNGTNGTLGSFHMQTCSFFVCQ
jgi:hypothetical protein